MEPEILAAVSTFNVPGGWDKKDAAVADFKEKMKLKLLDNQSGRCAYCGLPLETRNPEIDHIAPKGGEKRPKYPEVTFLPINLVYACHNCNSTSCKGQTDVVESKNDSDNYRLWSFKIVHPYLDDPRDFFENDKDDSILILPKKDADEIHTKKANYTIQMFGLTTEAKITEIAKQRFFEKYPDNIKKVILDITTYKE